MSPPDYGDPCGLARCVLSHQAWLVEGFAVNCRGYGPPIKSARQNLAESLKEIRGYAGEHGVTILLEPLKTRVYDWSVLQ